MSASGGGSTVNHLELTQAFIESCACTPLESLALAFQTALERFGFCHFACCSHVDPLHPPRAAVVLHNYPSEWVRVFSERKLHELDPVFLHAERSALPFFWDDADFRNQLSVPQKRILAEASKFGLAHGYTVPIHLPWVRGALRASCTVIPGAIAIDDRSYFAVHLMATHLYDAASRKLDWRDPGRGRGVLPARERQCLALAAQGKTDWEISRVLGLSESTVHKYIERAKRRLGVGTRVQAILEALRAKQIMFADIDRANET